MKKYTAKEIKTLESIEAIRLRPGMYIGDTGEYGLHHMLLEIISNSIDECLNGYGHIVEIAIDDEMAIVKDYGRGIPFDNMENGKSAIIELATNLHSGGKFGQGGYSVSGGLHGIGITAVNALSEKMTIISNRDGKQAIVNFSKGKVVDFNINETNAARGTTVKFIPDKDIFKEIKWNYETVRDKIQLLSYLTSGVKFELNFCGKIETFYSEQGLKDLVANKTSNPITDVVYLRQERNGYDIEIAFQYNNNGAEKIYAFTNNIPNVSGGSHVTGLKRGMTNTLNKLAKEYQLVEKTSENLKGDLLRKGLVAAISIKMQETPVFQGQTKEKLMTNNTQDGETISGKVSGILTANLAAHLSKKDLTKIIEKALLEKKAEDAAKRAREATRKIATGSKKMTIRDLAEKLVDCKSRNGELWLLEGDSAAGSAKSCRDVETQAILPLRGKVLNTFDKELADIIKNKEIKDILTTLGCGVGENFNIENLRYDKIVLLADADADGRILPVVLFH